MKRLLTAVIGFVLWTALPAVAADPDAMLYELTEDMHQTQTHRRATSALGGFANPNTPLCPPRLAFPRKFCVVNATGSNNISLSTGLGPVEGDFRVVKQDENPFDIAEEVRRRGRFSGQMDLSLTSSTFLGTMDATMSVGRTNTAFRAVVRLPVPCKGGFCYVTSGPDAIPTGLQLLQPHEYALGFPTVRLDIYFQ